MADSLSLFCSECPRAKPVGFASPKVHEDIWLQAKTYIRQQYYRCETFAQVKQLFVQFLERYEFSFPKLRRYG